MFSNGPRLCTLDQSSQVEEPAVAVVPSDNEAQRSAACDRIDEIVVRVQRYLYPTVLDRIGSDPPYDSNQAVWDDLVRVFEQARDTGLEQNHHKRVKLGMWIERLHSTFNYPASALDIFKDEEK